MPRDKRANIPRELSRAYAAGLWNGATLPRGLIAGLAGGIGAAGLLPVQPVALDERERALEAFARRRPEVGQEAHSLELREVRAQVQRRAECHGESAVGKRPAYDPARDKDARRVCADEKDVFKLAQVADEKIPGGLVPSRGGGQTFRGNAGYLSITAKNLLFTALWAIRAFSLVFFRYDFSNERG